jgi:hypothetical protein
MCISFVANAALHVGIEDILAKCRLLAIYWISPNATGVSIKS